MFFKILNDVLTTIFKRTIFKVIFTKCSLVGNDVQICSRAN